MRLHRLAGCWSVSALRQIHIHKQMPTTTTWFSSQIQYRQPCLSYADLGLHCADQPGLLSYCVPKRYFRTCVAQLSCVDLCGKRTCNRIVVLCKRVVEAAALPLLGSVCIPWLSRSYRRHPDNQWKPPYMDCGEYCLAGFVYVLFLRAQIVCTTSKAPR